MQWQGLSPMQTAPGALENCNLFLVCENTKESSQVMHLLKPVCWQPWLVLTLPCLRPWSFLGCRHLLTKGLWHRPSGFHVPLARKQRVSFVQCVLCGWRGRRLQENVEACYEKALMVSIGESKELWRRPSSLRMCEPWPQMWWAGQLVRETGVRLRAKDCAMLLSSFPSGATRSAFYLDRFFGVKESSIYFSKFRMILFSRYKTSTTRVSCRPIQLRSTCFRF